MRPSLINAIEGLSPFSTLNDEDDLLQRASLVSVQDLRALRTKQKICIPSDAHEFLTLLKRFGKLLYALFFDNCPLFQCITEIITALKTYSCEARERLNIASKASILWIIFTSTTICHRRGKHSL